MCLEYDGRRFLSSQKCSKRNKLRILLFFYLCYTTGKGKGKGKGKKKDEEAAEE